MAEYDFDLLSAGKTTNLMKAIGIACSTNDLSYTRFLIKVEQAYGCELTDTDKAVVDRWYSHRLGRGACQYLIQQKTPIPLGNRYARAASLLEDKINRLIQSRPDGHRRFVILRPLGIGTVIQHGYTRVDPTGQLSWYLFTQIGCYEAQFQSIVEDDSSIAWWRNGVPGMFKVYWSEENEQWMFDSSIAGSNRLLFTDRVAELPVHFVKGNHYWANQ